MFLKNGLFSLDNFCIFYTLFLEVSHSGHRSKSQELSWISIDSRRNTFKQPLVLNLQQVLRLKNQNITI